MFDNISFTIEKFEPKDFVRLTENYTQNDPLNKGDWFQTDWQNLRINYYPNQKKVRVSNSLHKFYNSEIVGLGTYNHNDYTMSQVNETILYLENAFNRSSKDMKLIGRFEFGINVNTQSVKPFDIIDRYQSMVTTATNSFNLMYNKTGKSTCKFCSFSHYTIKCYDKMRQMGLSGDNILRYEMVHHSSIKTREVFKKEEISLEDLMDNVIWNNCHERLVKSYDSIRMIGFPSDGANNYAKTLCYSFATLNKDYKMHLKNIMNELKEAHDVVKNSSENPHCMVREGLIRNYQRLILN